MYPLAPTHQHTPTHKHQWTFPTNDKENIFTDKNQHLIKLANENANYNDKIEIHHDSTNTTDVVLIVCITLYTKMLKWLEIKITKLSIFSLNRRSMNANWDSLNQLIYDKWALPLCFL